MPTKNTASKSKTNIKFPPVGEKTRQQFLPMFFGMSMGVPSAPSGLFETYRNMRKNPTIALARAVSSMPILTAEYSIKKDDDVDDEILKFIQGQINNIWDILINTILYSMDFGFQSYEKIWELKTINGKQKYVIKKLKALSADNIKVLTDEVTGNFAGIKQNNVEMAPDKCLHYVYDGEPGNYYGRSRHENIREYAWWPWVQTSKNLSKYCSKVSGVIPIIKYPIGESRDKSGSLESNYDIAKAVLNNLGSGSGVVMPQELLPWVQDLARQGIDPDKFAAWQISFLETKGTHAAGFINTLKHYEVLMLRGWLIPERAAIEGQYGTKAEAGTHGDLANTIAELFFADILRHLNWYIINPLLIYNFGTEYENKVWIETAGMDPRIMEFYREVLKGVLTSPTNIDLFQTWLDVNALMDLAGLPKAKENINDLESQYEETETEEASSKIMTPEQINKLKNVYKSISE